MFNKVTSLCTQRCELRQSSKLRQSSRIQTSPMGDALPQTAKIIRDKD